jgi:hypothetical protein
MRPIDAGPSRRWLRRSLAALTLAGAACLPPTAHWPYRGNFVCSRNQTAQTRQVVAEDGRGRQLAVRLARAGEEKCYRWPFVDYDGRVGLATGQDTVWGEWFRPWHGVRGGEPAGTPRPVSGGGHHAPR